MTPDEAAASSGAHRPAVGHRGDRRPSRLEGDREAAAAVLRRKGRAPQAVEQKLELMHDAVEQVVRD
jgi:hypothetical protein